MRRLVLLLLAACAASAQAAPDAPALDLKLAYYSRVRTPEGVTREARYEEQMLRRPDHVWVARVLPAAAAAPEGGHGHFNPVLLPRHVVNQGGRLRLEYVDRKAREVIAIPPAEYANVGFDGSWTQAWYLLDPARVLTLPLSRRVSPVPGAQWREQEKAGRFERVLWDGARQVALVIESGDSAGNVLHRIEVSVLPRLEQRLPWLGLAGYAQKEYADFLD